MSSRHEPRPFGDYLLTALLAEDALGRVFRARRLSGDNGFVRLRILETSELSEDSVLDAIQEYGEIHSFLKNPAIARGVQMDAVDGTPFIAWNEESGRTLDALLARVAVQGQRVPPEHALLIAEKIASALEHAYNTTVDGERTLHGLVWPGFVSITDDGETRLTGFGIAPGVMPSLDSPRLESDVAPYIAPEQRATRKVGRNADVYSVGVILFELLAGRLPSPADPIADVRTMARQEGAVLTPEVLALLRTALSPAEARYKTAAELRRELGKLLFSGPYAPSTFNLAFFLNHLFGPDIEAEAEARDSESRTDRGAGPPRPAAPSAAPRPSLPRAPERSGGLPLERARVPVAAAGSLPSRTKTPPRRPVAIVLAALLVAAVVGAVYVLSRSPSRKGAAAAPLASPIPAVPPTPTALPTPEAPAATVGMTDAEFKGEVSRRVAQELKKIGDELEKKEQAAAKAAAAAQEPRDLPAPEPDPTPAPRPAEEAPEPATPPPTAAPEPGRGAAREPTADVSAGAGPGREPEEVIEVPPRIKMVIKPSYPPMALRQRIGGIVVLRILVSETGAPLDVQVIRGARGGLTEAAAAAARRWTFEPATRNGQPVQGWATVPIPFEP